MDTVSFGTKNSYTDFGLILSSKDISLPKPKTKKVEVPGADGELDLTDVLTTDVKYENRELHFTFTVIDHFNGWAARLSQVTNYLHGKVLNVYMDWDKNFFYRGRCTVNSFKSNKRTGSIVIDVNAEPYKIERNAINQPWEWDGFNFIDGIIRHNNFNIQVGENYITLINGRKPASPIITSTVAMVVYFDGKSIIVPPGTTTLNEIKLKEGENVLRLSASGSDTIEITWEGGSL